jgi:hypothetical protein
MPGKTPKTPKYKHRLSPESEEKIKKLKEIDLSDELFRQEYEAIYGPDSPATVKRLEAAAAAAIAGAARREAEMERERALRRGGSKKKTSKRKSRKCRNTRRCK